VSLPGLEHLPYTSLVQHHLVWDGALQWGDLSVKVTEAVSGLEPQSTRKLESILLVWKLQEKLCAIVHGFVYRETVDYLTILSVPRLHDASVVKSTAEILKYKTFLIIFLIRILGGGWSPYWVHSAHRPLNDLFYLPRVIMMVENLVEWRTAGETEVLGENLPQRQFVHHKSHLPDPGWNPGLRGGKPATNRLSYGAANIKFTCRFIDLGGKLKWY
jgi:hypothetical protein